MISVFGWSGNEFSITSASCILGIIIMLFEECFVTCM